MVSDPERSVAFRAMWAQVVSPVFERMNNLIEKGAPPEHLVHFTDAAGFLGITKDKKLRLGRALSSNDPKELKHGIRLARAEIIRRTKGEKTLADLGQEMLLSLEGKRSDGTRGLQMDPHICCFTSDDSVRRIGHWAMYGRNGAGFALRFRAEELADGPAGAIKPLKGSFAKVVYKLSEQKTRTEDLVQLAIEKCTEAGQYAADNYSGRDWEVPFAFQAAHAMGSIMVAHAATMKGPEFTAEKEWRLVNLGLVDKIDGSVPAGPLLRTFYEFPFDAEVLETVCVGRAQAEINRQVAARLLNERGFDKTKLERGKVELRALS